MTAPIDDIADEADRSDYENRAALAVFMVEQTRRLIEIAQAADRPEVVERLREVLADAETIAMLWAPDREH